MKSKIICIAMAALLVGCSSVSKLAQMPLQVAPEISQKTEFSKEELQVWPHADLKDSPSFNLAGAYNLLKDIKPKTTIVAVVDSGVDINHEDLKDVIWTNPKEIPNNGIDDDNNGYVDDIHGWNFLGDVYEEAVEYTRIVRDAKDKNSQMYKDALKKYEQELENAKAEREFIKEFELGFSKADQLLQQKTGKNVYTAEDLNNIKDNDEKTQLALEIIKTRVFDRGRTIEEFYEIIKDGKKYIEGRLNNNLNKDVNFRAKHLNDNVNDINDKFYGNNNVIGPNPEGADHGTHVAGIIAASRNNGLGMNGVADAVKIMAVRAVPDGDEYDKDIALAIRYAVDNGAKVINTSFGKNFSPNAQWVRDAFKYAGEKDVLIVNAAGNDSMDNDTEITFPDDNINGIEYTNNVLTIGALNYEYNENMLADFSNYGKNNVDIFAPGVKIYSTVPGSKYKNMNGTSMATPEAAGLAALIRSYFPSLKASEVKEIIMQSGVLPKIDKVIVGGNPDDKRAMKDICKTGKIINAYNAVILAAKKVSSKK